MSQSPRRHGIKRKKKIKNRQTCASDKVAQRSLLVHLDNAVLALRPPPFPHDCPHAKNKRQMHRKKKVPLNLCRSRVERRCVSWLGYDTRALYISRCVEFQACSIMQWEQWPPCENRCEAAIDRFFLFFIFSFFHCERR